MTNYNKCPLIKIIDFQMRGDDYNCPKYWQFERIDDIAKSLNIDMIDKPLQRSCLASYLKDMYKPFNDYLKNNHSHVFARHRNSRYASDLEYHALHEYLKINGFTKVNVNKFIEIDNNDRNVFNNDRQEAIPMYFGKYGSIKNIKESDYDCNKFEKYRYSYIYTDKEYLYESQKYEDENNDENDDN